MPAKRNYYRLGLFVLASLALLVLLLFLLGGRSLFKPFVIIETYFNESVAGLDVGAPVKFRGVNVGRVSWIGISSQVYQRDVLLDDAKNYIVVRMRIDDFDDDSGPDVLEAYVRRGLRASTQLAGITGQLFVSLDFVKADDMRRLDFDWKPKYPYIPSAPSLTNQIISNAQSFLASLNQANVQDLGQNLNKLVVTLETQMQKAQLDEIASDVRTALQTMQSALRRVDNVLAKGELEQTLGSMRTATQRLNVILAEPGLVETPRNLAAATASLRQIMESGELQRAVARIDQAAGEARNLIGANQDDVRRAIEDVQVAAENLRSLTALLSRDPSALLFSSPPRPVVLPTETR
jgi:phospholipid/cholesterol/gamma-HCH transport system substrate-binding protein/paraquat-inducible protein B